MLELTYRQASAEDIPVIFSFSKDLIDQYEDIRSIQYDKVLSWVEKKIGSNINKYTCIYQGNTKVGYFCFSKDSKAWELDDLYVFPEFREKGIGTRVVKKCLDCADAPVFLYVFTGNTGAIRLYEKLGFREAEIVSPTRKILLREG